MSSVYRIPWGNARKKGEGVCLPKRNNPLPKLMISCLLDCITGGNIDDGRLHLRFRFLLNFYTHSIAYACIVAHSSVFLVLGVFFSLFLISVGLFFTSDDALVQTAQNLFFLFFLYFFFLKNMYNRISVYLPRLAICNRKQNLTSHWLKGIYKINTCTEFFGF